MNNNLVYISAFLLAAIVAAGCSNTKDATPTPQAATNPTQTSTSIPTPNPSPTPFILKLDAQTLQSQINALIEAERQFQPQIIVGVAIEDYLTGDIIEINADQVFDAASIGKLPILMLLYDQIAAGKIKEDDTITITEQNIERYGTGSIQYQALPKEYTIKELAELMISVSDNTASSVLAAKIGRDNLAVYVKNKGMSGTNTKANDTVPFDTLILLRELYQRSIQRELYAQSMLTYMTNTSFEDRIPAKLPEDITVSHKIGTQAGEFHDAGIVFVEGRPFGIAIYTKQASNESRAKELIADITLAAYNNISDLSSK